MTPSPDSTRPAWGCPARSTTPPPPRRPSPSSPVTKLPRRRPPPTHPHAALPNRGQITRPLTPGNVHVVSRLRMDAALWERPPARRPGQIGRPRRRGARLPSPQASAAARQHWHRLPVTLYGRAVITQVFRCTALWYAALPGQPVRIVVVRDPNGQRRDEAFFCTDLSAGATFILETYARRWTLEVTFHDAKQSLGFEDPQSQASAAVRRTAPLALVVYDLIVLWYAGRLRDGHAATWPTRPWYRQKTKPSFLDMLTALRREAWQHYVYQPPSRQRRRQNPTISWPAAVLATA
ncbi:MAG: IS701 family transposase [bacterium]